MLKSDDDAAPRILDETGGYGADVVIDFVGVQPTVDLAAQVIAPEGLIRFVGLGGGKLSFGAVAEGTSLPWESTCSVPSAAPSGLAGGARARPTGTPVETVRYRLADFQQHSTTSRRAELPAAPSSSPDMGAHCQLESIAPQRYRSTTSGADAEYRQPMEPRPGCRPSCRT